MIVNTIPLAEDLLNWTREFAQATLPVCLNLPAEIIRQALATHLDKKLAEISPKADTEELLEKMGIAAIVEYGRERIGWIATTDPIEAEELQQLYSSEPYSKIRRELGIDCYWIFVVDPQFLDHYFSEDLYESAPEPIEMYEQFPELLHLEDRKECIVVKL